MDHPPNLRIASLVSLLVTLSWACDAPAPADSAPDATAPAQLPATPDEQLPAAPDEPLPATPSEATPPQPAPATPSPASGTGLRLYGKASDALTAILAALTLPASADVAAIEKQAWAHHKAKEFHEAAEAFAMLTKLDTRAWKHPFNAACSAAKRLELERAQVFLVEALRRGDQATRSKAGRDDDLSPLRVHPWFEELLAADSDGLAAWEIREPVVGIAPYPEGEAPLLVRNVRAVSKPYHQTTKLGVSYEVEKVADKFRGSYWLLATCKHGDRYLYANNVISTEIDGAAGKPIETELHTANLWPSPRALDHCELDFIGAPADSLQSLRPFRSMARFCLKSGQVTDGGCPDFQRPVTDEPVVLSSTTDWIPAVGDTSKVRVIVYFELLLGRRPDWEINRRAKLDCVVAGKQVTQEQPMLHTPWHARPGDTLQTYVNLAFDAPPTRCELEMIRYDRGPKHYTTIPRYCLDGETFQPCKP